MKKLITLLVAAFTMSCVLADGGALDEASSPKQAADQLTAWAAGFCKGLQDKHGTEFNACFKQVTDQMIAKIESTKPQDK